MKVLALASLLGLAACHRTSGPTLLTTPAMGQRPWISVSLIVAGDEADEDKRDTCIEEARNAGIELAPNAPRGGTLYFLDHDDYLDIPGAPHMVFSAMGPDATCRIALARLTELDRIVPFHNGAPRPDCQDVGRVEGSDSGFLHPGSYDAAVAEAQFKVRMMGGNLFVQDSSRQIATRVVVNGRGFRCSG